jgi:hypothetical protein
VPKGNIKSYSYYSRIRFQDNMKKFSKKILTKQVGLTSKGNSWMKEEE